MRNRPDNWSTKRLTKTTWTGLLASAMKLENQKLMHFEVIAHLFRQIGGHKGQIISEQMRGVLKFSKKATKYCQDFCPSL